VSFSTIVSFLAFLAFAFLEPNHVLSFSLSCLVYCS
jgi:hypothetical protein